MELMLIELVTKFPFMSAVIMIMGVFRVIFKPTMTWISQVVEATPTKKDDEFWAKVQASSIYKKVSWFVDYLLSIKLPQAPVKQA